MFVGDVAAAIADAVDGSAKAGTIYELGGPEVKTFKELMQYVLATIERKRLLVPVPFFAAKIKAALLQYLPKPPLTPDQVELLRVDNVVSEAAKAEGRTLQGLGIEPEPHRGDRAVLSLALPQDRPVPQSHGLIAAALPKINRQDAAGADNDRATRRTARSCGAACSRRNVFTTIQPKMNDEDEADGDQHHVAVRSSARSL